MDITGFDLATMAMIDPKAEDGAGDREATVQAERKTDLPLDAVEETALEDLGSMAKDISVDPHKTPRQACDDSEAESPSSELEEGDATVETYKVYKRRWLGLVQLTLLNILVSWEVSGAYKPNLQILRAAVCAVLRD